MARITEKQDTAHRPAWMAVERRPQDSLRRKWAAQALDLGLRVLGPGFETERNGTIFKGTSNIMKYDGMAGKWEKKAGWQSSGLGDWGAIVRRMAEE